jgi:hypothetical protein
MALAKQKRLANAPAFSKMCSIGLTACCAVNAAACGLRAINSTGYILANAADGVAARAQSHEGYENGSGSGGETFGHIKTPLDVCA